MKKRILIADADRELLDLAHRFFLAAGYSVRIVSEGVECFGSLAASHPHFCLALETELLWGGGDGVLVFISQDPRRLHTVSIVLTTRRLDTPLPLKDITIVGRRQKPVRLREILQTIQSATRNLSSRMASQTQRHDDTRKVPGANKDNPFNQPQTSKVGHAKAS